MAACGINFGDAVVALFRFAVAESLRLLLDRGLEGLNKAAATSFANVSSATLLRFFCSFGPVVDLDGRGG